MTPEGIAGTRLRNQHISSAGLRRPEDVVAWLGAVQAQEFEPATWAVGLRMRDGAAAQDVQRAFDEGRILRTHVMRPTWHFVTPNDIRWLQALTAPRVQRIAASYNRRLALDARTLSRGMSIIERALGDRQYLTRTELAERLGRAKLAVSGQRLAHLVMHAELEALICSGPRRGRHSTYALVSERAPASGVLPREEALATLVRCYFTSHGPATVRDFVWWSGLTAADAKRGLEMNDAKREQRDGLTYWTMARRAAGPVRDDRAYLLPVYDEYLIAYRDRVAVPHWPGGLPSAADRGVTFQHAIVIAGQVAGTWRLTRDAQGSGVSPVPLRALTVVEKKAVADAVARYQAFVGPHP